MRSRYDIVIVGGGHNALVAAAYLGRAGRSVLVCERLGDVGGAAVSSRAFAGVDARLSRYAYLVSLLPTKVMQDLGLRVDLRRRRVSSFTPVVRHGAPTGLYVGRGSADEDARTDASFASVTGGSANGKAWRELYGRMARAADVLAPTLLRPLTSGAEARRAFGDDELWTALFERPIGELIDDTFTDDTVRGVVGTDALIGTFADLHDPSLVQNACFLYHVIGDGHGEWNVPVGGMGALTGGLATIARAAGAEIVTDASVVAVRSDGVEAEVDISVAAASPQTVGARWVLAGCAPRELDRLLGRPSPDEDVEGCQVKVNMLLTRLPQLRSGADPFDAFAGTLHIDEDAAQLAAAYTSAAAGRLPDVLPAEVYCHSLTDASILSPELAASGHHTLTLFGLHVPASLFRADNAGTRNEAVARYLSQINAFLAEPIEECLALDADGRPCLEAKSPLDLEAELGLPGGNIFHRPLAMPFATDEHPEDTWGVETDLANVLVCGAGAVRGGGVSGIPGHNAAMAVLTG
jgi:phytoene dehydrogenase-like protein